MRTTLDIAEDVLQAARELARRQRKTAGQVLTELARQALTKSGAASRSAASNRPVAEVLGFRPFPGRGGIVTNDLVNQLRDAEPD